MMLLSLVALPALICGTLGGKTPGMPGNITGGI